MERFTLAKILLYVVTTAAVIEAIFIAILLIQNAHQAADIQDFKDTATVACVRSKVFGPSLADAYERYNILNETQLEVYRDSIPERCPK